jgi:hypothetical protein
VLTADGLFIWRGALNTLAEKTEVLAIDVSCSPMMRAVANARETRCCVLLVASGRTGFGLRVKELRECMQSKSETATARQDGFANTTPLIAGNQCRPPVYLPKTPFSGSHVGLSRQCGVRGCVMRFGPACIDFAQREASISRLTSE